MEEQLTYHQKIEALNQRRLERGYQSHQNGIKSVGKVIEKFLSQVEVSDSDPEPPKPKRSRKERALLVKVRFMHEVEKLITGEDPFQVTEDNQKILRELVNYFTGDLDFITSGLIENSASFKKGIALIGPPGVGKSLILRAFSKALKVSEPEYPEEMAAFAFKSSTQICEEIDSTREKSELFNDYGRRITAKGSGGMMLNHLCIDDLGKEEIERAYQYGRNPIKIIINDRWDRLRHGARFHFTSNLNLDGLEAVYNPAIVDRLRDMCNIIQVGGESFRK